MVQQTPAEFGRIDALVNNSGIYPTAPFTEISLDAWRRVFAVNVEGTFLAAKAVAPTMKAARYGRIINISSSTVSIGVAEMTHYVTSQAAIIGFTRSIARELANDGITVNATSPGLAMTETARTHLGRLLTKRSSFKQTSSSEEPADVVAAVAFLVSEGARFITDQAINVDGGQAMH